MILKEVKNSSNYFILYSDEGIFGKSEELYMNSMAGFDRLFEDKPERIDRQIHTSQKYKFDFLDINNINEVKVIFLDGNTLNYKINNNSIYSRSVIPKL